MVFTMILHHELVYFHISKNNGSDGMQKHLLQILSHLTKALFFPSALIVLYSIILEKWS